MRNGSFMLIIGWGLATPLLAWLALPGRFSFPVLLAFCLLPLLHGLAAAPSLWRSMRWALVVGIVFQVSQLYWIVSVLQQYGGLPWFIAVPAMLLLCVYMSLYTVVFGAGYHYLHRSSSSLALVIGAPALWVGLDWVRSWFIGGFPWMDIGYGLWPYSWALQGADLVGHYGLSYLVVLVNVVLLVQFQLKRPVRQRGLAALVCLVVATTWVAYSVYRRPQIDRLVTSADTAVVGLVQGNVEQDRKWSPEARLKTVTDYVELSAGLLEQERVELIVWPETALPFYPRRDELLQPLIDLVWANRVHLMSGVPWYEVEQTDKSRLVRYYNGAMLMDPSTSFSVGYYKNQLVPFGEYVPFKEYLPFVAPLVEAAGDFTRGRIERTLDAGEIRSGVLICYESIFGTLGRAWVNEGANLLINLTNDAWYGKSSAPYQSWAMTVFRTVETRRALVRSANTGISGYIDPTGSVVLESGIFIPWAAPVTVPLLEVETLFVKGGYLFAPLCGAIGLLLVLVSVVGCRAGAIPSSKNFGDRQA